MVSAGRRLVLVVAACDSEVTSPVAVVIGVERGAARRPAAEDVIPHSATLAPAYPALPEPCTALTSSSVQSPSPPPPRPRCPPSSPPYALSPSATSPTGRPPLPQTPRASGPRHACQCLPDHKLHDWCVHRVKWQPSNSPAAASTSPTPPQRERVVASSPASRPVPSTSSRRVSRTSARPSARKATRVSSVRHHSVLATFISTRLDPNASACRHRAVHPLARWLPRPLPRPRPHNPWLPPHLGHLLRRVRRHQDLLRRAAPRHTAPRTETKLELLDTRRLSGSPPKGLPADHARAPLGLAHPLCHDRRRCEHDMHQPAVGHQDAGHGTRQASLDERTSSD